MNWQLPISIEVLYAGLAGLVLALIIASYQQRRLSVFFLLALRLAIGWHFLFEGLHKVHSVYTGPNDRTKVFSSEPYFSTAAGPIAPYMRAQFQDVPALLAERVKAPKPIKPAEFARLTIPEQAEACPEAVARSLNAVEPQCAEAIKASALKAMDQIARETKARLEKASDGEEKRRIAMEAAERNAAQQKRIDEATTLAKEAIQSAKAAYARWVYGVDAREVDIKAFSGDKPRLTAPQRLEWLEMLRQRLDEAQARAKAELGNGYGYERDRVHALRLELLAAEAQLAQDANDFLAELRNDLTGGKEGADIPPSRGPLLDKITMWFLVAVGVSLLAGFLTKLGLLAGAGFLVITYLTHPAFPWLVQPPGTEGNPLFVNKNVIEMLAMLALACFPTGRWMGLDALFLGVERRPELMVGRSPPAGEPPPQPRSLQQMRRP